MRTSKVFVFIMALGAVAIMAAIFDIAIIVGRGLRPWLGWMLP